VPPSGNAAAATEVVGGSSFSSSSPSSSSEAAPATVLSGGGDGSGEMSDDDGGGSSSGGGGGGDLAGGSTFDAAAAALDAEVGLLQAPCALLLSSSSSTAAAAGHFPPQGTLRRHWRKALEAAALSTQYRQPLSVASSSAPAAIDVRSDLVGNGAAVGASASVGGVVVGCGGAGVGGKQDADGDSCMEGRVVGEDGDGGGGGEEDEEGGRVSGCESAFALLVYTLSDSAREVCIRSHGL